jgi:hypothetical protein
MFVFCVVAEVALVLVWRVEEAAEEEGREEVGEDDGVEVDGRDIGVAAELVAAEAIDEAVEAIDDCALDAAEAREDSALDAGARADESSVNGRDVAEPETEGTAAEVVACEGCPDVAADDCGGAGMPGVYEG